MHSFIYDHKCLLFTELVQDIFQYEKYLRKYFKANTETVNNIELPHIGSMTNLINQVKRLAAYHKF